MIGALDNAYLDSSKNLLLYGNLSRTTAEILISKVHGKTQTPKEGIEDLS